MNNSWAQAGKKRNMLLELSLMTRMSHMSLVIVWGLTSIEVAPTIKLIQTIVLMTFIFPDVKCDFTLMYMHMHMNYFLSRSLLRATWSTTVSSSACPLGPAPLAAVHCLVCRVGSLVELWIKYLNITECKEHRWPACFMVVNVTIKVLHNFITKWENLETLCYMCVLL